MTRQQILLTCYNAGPKVEESQMIGTKSKFYFLLEPKPEFAHITGTKRDIYPKKNNNFKFEDIIFFT